MNLKEIKKRIEKLKTLEQDLVNFEGRVISITRLTILKYLCRDSLAMLKFSYYIAEIVHHRIKYVEDDTSLETQVNKSLQIMKQIIADASPALDIENSVLRTLIDIRSEIMDYQNTIKSQKWSDVRVITNWDLLLIEEAISCFIHSNRPEMGYELARSYTNKYDSSYGPGLIPASLKYVKEVNRYWINYFNEKEIESKQKN